MPSEADFHEAISTRGDCWYSACLRVTRNAELGERTDFSDTLMSVFRNAESADVKSAALNGLLIASHEQGVLALYRESNDAAEKRELLRTLANMGSDEVWDIVDDALGGDQ